MAIPASFDSATGALTGDNLDHTIATSHDAARPTPSLRDDPDAGSGIQSAVHRPTPSLRDDPDAGGQIQSAVHRPAPSLRSDPDSGGQIPERRAPAGPQPPGRPRRRRPDPQRHAAADAQPLGRSRRRRPDPKCRAAVRGRPAHVHCVRAGRRERSAGHAGRNLPARAGHGVIFRRGRRGHLDDAPLGAETSQPSFLTTPQHP